MNTAKKINLVWSCRKDGGQQDATQSVTLLRYMQQKQRKAKKTWMDNVKEDLRTHNIDTRDVTDLTRDRTTWDESCTNSSSV